MYTPAYPASVGPTPALCGGDHRISEKGLGMKVTSRIALAGFAVTSSIVLGAAPALAHECINASKPAAAGVQLVIGPTGIAWTTPGLAKRFANGLVDPNTGEGFHGLIGFDFNGDGVVDFSTYIVGPDDEIPLLAQFNGPACHGITNIGVYMSECVVVTLFLGGTPGSRLSVSTPPRCVVTDCAVLRQAHDAGQVAAHPGAQHGLERDVP